MQDFLQTWHSAARTSVGLFYTAFWAFGLGYLVSSMIQVFVTRERMRETMGGSGPKAVGLGAFFGFISSSCSFAALSTSRSLFSKGAGLVPSLAFLLASTNLVIELGIVIAVFLSWQFVVGEYVGGVLLILSMWLLVRLTHPTKLIESARSRARAKEGDSGASEVPDWRRLVRSREGWLKVAGRYFMEWQMVWKDVTVGFTVAGIIAAFVPKAFFQTLFVGAGAADPTFGEVLLQTIVGPVAAFFTFIGSMGNIPLASVLFGNGVSFAGVMAFIFSDLVVLPVTRILGQYFGWKMALYIVGVFLVSLVGAALALHYGFSTAGLLPDPSTAKQVTERSFFGVDYTLVLNGVFLVLTVGLVAWKSNNGGLMMMGGGLSDTVLRALAWLCFAWLAGGWLVPLFVG